MKSKQKKAVGCMVGSMCMMTGSVAVHAKDTFDFLTSGNGNSTIAGMTSEIQSAGKSFYDLVFAVGSLGLVISIVVTGLAIGLFKNASKREENKTQLIYIGLACILVFGAISIASFGESFAGSLFQVK